jgi:hypothetical protein
LKYDFAASLQWICGAGDACALPQFGLGTIRHSNGVNMGAIAEGIVAYAQILIDQTDGSLEEVDNALGMSQICFNLALMPAEERTSFLKDLQPDLGMNDQELEEFQRDVVVPMIRRHEKMFPLMHLRSAFGSMDGFFSPRQSVLATKPKQKYPGAEPYEPCPCNSGKKYRFCCGKKS